MMDRTYRDVDDSILVIISSQNWKIRTGLIAVYPTCEKVKHTFGSVEVCDSPAFMNRIINLKHP